MMKEDRKDDVIIYME